MSKRAYYNLLDGLMTVAIAVGVLSAIGLFVLGAVSFVRGLV